ncbi:hypothetical protein [Sphingobacterium multivorum]|uniref:hypothetical protein n=1 Tax=Sphingobacterium multivorum TaxID=28454 RepID=UPI003DA534A8
MKQSLDLDTFVKTLTDKGYDGYFHTEAAYADKLKDSINRFLDACENGTDKPLYANSFSLRTYLEWNGEDKPKTECYMRVRYEDSKFDVQKMNIERTDRYGHSMKKSELTNLTTGTVPTAKEALAKVLDTPKQQFSSRKRGFRM